jgi:hypothetical protein
VRAEWAPLSREQTMAGMDAGATWLALGVLAAGFFAGVLCLWLDRPMLGIVVGVGAVPLALVVWVADRGRT